MNSRAVPSPATKSPSPDFTEPRIEEKRRKLEQLKARQQRVEQRLSYISSSKARKDDTRRKILLGAILLSKVELGEFDERLLRKWLDQVLTRKDDRELFGLPPSSAS